MRTAKKSVSFISIITIGYILSVCILSVCLLLAGCSANEFGSILLKPEPGTKLYRNEYFGFSFDYNGFTLDDSMEAVKTSFTSDSTKVEIYFDDFRGRKDDSDTIGYGNNSIKKGPYIYNVKTQDISYREHKAKLYKWELKALKHVDYYKYFASVEIYKSSKEIYTIYIKSKAEINVNDFISRFAIFDRKSSNTLKPIKLMNDNGKYKGRLKRFYNDNFCQSKLQWGIFEPSTIKGLQKLQRLEKDLDYKFNALLQYYDLKQTIDISNLKEITRSGRFVEFTYQTTIYGIHNPNYMYEILDGCHDDALNTLAERLKDLKKPILFRLNNEMNGDWCDYCAYHYQKDTDIFIIVWKHIYRKFREAGAENVLWVWNPNWGDFPDFKWNHYLNYFPGVEYVDIIGLTGYNTGNYYKAEKWKSFREIYDPMVKEYKEYFINYPLVITEFGCSDCGGDKAAWLLDMFDVIDSYGISLAIYWNSKDYDAAAGIPSRTYCFTEDDRLMNIMRNGLKLYK
ncbi:MAG: glycoside hydrolase family 26 protein [Bacillota bacterium]